MQFFAACLRLVFAYPLDLSSPCKVSSEKNMKEASELVLHYKPHKPSFHIKINCPCLLPKQWYETAVNILYVHIAAIPLITDVSRLGLADFC